MIVAIEEGGKYARIEENRGAGYTGRCWDSFYGLEGVYGVFHLFWSLLVFCLVVKKKRE